jgi:hypothetical protein
MEKEKICWLPVKMYVSKNTVSAKQGTLSTREKFLPVKGIESLFTSFMVTFKWLHLCVDSYMYF